jgi:integrase
MNVKLANVEGKTIKSIRSYLDEENEPHLDIQFTDKTVLDIRMKPNSEFVVEWMGEDYCLRENPLSESPMLNSDCLGKTEPTRGSPASMREHLRRRYQKGTLELHNGKWTLRFLEDIHTASGQIRRKARRVYLGGSPPQMTKKMALRIAEPVIARVNSSTQPKTVITLAGFLVGWEPLGMPKTETARNFRSALNKYLKPTFGKTRLSDIQTEEIQRFISMTPTGAANMRNIIKCFRSIWKSARAWGYVSHNPFDGIILPTIEKTEQRFFTVAEIRLILTYALEPFRTLYWVLAQTGLRIGEVLALTWDTVDLESGVVLVCASVARGKLRENKTKSKNSKRIIPISPCLQQHLSMFRTKLWQVNPHNLLFANTKQNSWKAENLLEGHLQPLLAELKIKHAGFHAFRHANATLLSLMDVPMEIRRARMGHTVTETTMIYTHVIEARAREVASGFDHFLLPEMAANG